MTDQGVLTLMRFQEDEVCVDFSTEVAVEAEEAVCYNRLCGGVGDGVNKGYMT